MLKSLSIRGFRNLKSLELDQLARVNVFVGPNGAGKTSILEAIHCLSSSHSFRTRKHGSLVHFKSDNFLVFGRYSAMPSSHSVGDGEVETPMRDVASERDFDLARVGVSRSRSGDPVIKLNGTRIRRLSELSQQFPVLVLNSDSFDMLLGGPSKRRRLLDWCLFHVKQQDFIDVWSRYQRVLKQRNDALRRAKMGGRLEIEPWDQQLTGLGELLDEARQEQAKEFFEVFEAVLSGQDSQPSLGGVSVDRAQGLAGLFSGLPKLKLRYKSGFDRYSSMAEAVNAELTGDIQAGVSRYGPHRADISFTVGGKAAAEILSRGQLKTLVCALVITQLVLLKRYAKDRCVWVLLDDLPAELDTTHRKAVLSRFINEDNTQLFLSSVESDSFRQDLKGLECRVFHVKQGCVEENSEW